MLRLLLLRAYWGGDEDDNEDTEFGDAVQPLKIAIRPLAAHSTRTYRLPARAHTYRRPVRARTLTDCLLAIGYFRKTRVYKAFIVSN
jgi:hypothetical protein